MMYKTTDSQYLKLKYGRQVRASLQLLYNSNKQFITNLYQLDACGRPFSGTIVSLSIPVLVVGSRRLSFPNYVFRLPLGLCF